MMNRSIPLSTLNLKSTKGKTGLLGGAGYLMGKSGAGKGKFDLDFILEKDEDFTQGAAALKASTGSFSKTTGSSGGR